MVQFHVVTMKADKLYMVERNNNLKGVYIYNSMVSAKKGNE